MDNMGFNGGNGIEGDGNLLSNTREALSPLTLVKKFWRILIKRIQILRRRLQYSIRKSRNDHIKNGGFSVLRVSLTIYVVVFLVSIFVNKTTFYGHCIGKVDYSLQSWKTPFYSPLGYSACENNTYTSATDVTFHSPMNYDGNTMTSPSIEKESFRNYGAGPDSRTLHIMGSMDTNFVRIYGEWFRFFTAMMLHGGWMHLLNNAVAHIIVLYIIEPDWGTCRTTLAYLVTGCGGYLVGSVLVPCLRQVGSSGIQLGFLGCMMPYCVEHWYEMGAPHLILLLSIGISFVDLILVEPNISKHIHMGGYLCGVFFGFSTIKSVAFFDRGPLYHRLMIWLFSRWLSETTKQRYHHSISKSMQVEDIARVQYEHNAKANAHAYRFLKHLLGIYPYGPYRMRLRDNITRVISFIILVG